LKLSIDEILEASGGELRKGDPRAIVRSISTDSRSLQNGDYFLCLIGENFDGHDFATQAAAQGAGGLILQKGRIPEAALEGLKLPVIEVTDSLRAFGDIARAWRRKFSIPLVAIGGSNGKTSTKDMTAAIFSAQYKTLSTEGNLNNLIGVPKMLLKLEESHEAAIIEMGMNDFGEMGRLTEIAEPTVGLLTNTGYEHVEKMKDLEGVARSNGEMFERLPSGALALVNADDDYILRMPTRAYKISFGIQRPADVYCESHRLSDQGITLTLSFRGKKYEFEAPVQGQANLKNAVAALAAGFALGLDPAKMRKGLAAYKGRAMRMEVLRLGRGITLLNDCYNANPSSMSAALETLAFLKKTSPGLAVLGEMRELGDFAEQGHRLVGEAVAKSGIARLISVGPHAAAMVDAAVRAGMTPESCLAAATQDEAVGKLLAWAPECEFLLVKGSRGARMEKMTDLLKGKFA